MLYTEDLIMHYYVGFFANWLTYTVTQESLLILSAIYLFQNFTSKQATNCYDQVIVLLKNYV